MKKKSAAASAVHKKRAAKNTPAFEWSAYKIYAELFVILVLVFIAYGNSIKNYYNIDDGYVVSLDEANPLTKEGIKAIPEIFMSNYNVGEGVTYGYRPMGKATMAIEYSLWGNNPQYSHFINVLLFALNCFLLLLFIRKVGKLLNYNNTVVLYAAVLLYILHPIHTEVVCSIKNREEILCFIFSLSALLSYLRYRETSSPVYILIFLVFMLAALFSKETAVLVMGIIGLLSFYQGLMPGAQSSRLWQSVRKAVINKQVWLFILLAFIAQHIILNYIPGLLPGAATGTKLETFESNPLRYFPAAHIFPNSVQTVLFYLKKLLVPFPLLFYYGYNMLPDKGWNTVYPYVGILLLAGLGGLLWYVVRKREKLFLSFWIFCFFLLLLPFANLITFTTGVVGERLMYQASAAFCVVFSILLYNLAVKLQPYLIHYHIKVQQQRLLNLILLLIAGPYLWLTVDRNNDWRNKDSLYKHDIGFLKNSARANYMMAGYIMNNLPQNAPDYERSMRINEAKDYLNQAVKISPKFDEAWLGLSNIYSNYLSMNDSAMHVLSKVNTSDKKTSSKTLEEYGDMYYYDSLNTPMALEYYYQGIRQDPVNRRLYMKLTQVLFKNKQFDSLVSLGNIGVKNGWQEGYINRGDAYINLGDTARAVQNYQKAIDMGYRNSRLINNLAHYYFAKGQTEKIKKLPLPKEPSPDK